MTGRHLYPSGGKKQRTNQLARTNELCPNESLTYSLNHVVCVRSL